MCAPDEVGLGRYDVKTHGTQLGSQLIAALAYVSNVRGQPFLVADGCGCAGAGGSVWLSGASVFGVGTISVDGSDIDTAAGPVRISSSVLAELKKEHRSEPHRYRALQEFLGMFSAMRPSG